jgi:hypothetical protein
VANSNPITLNTRGETPSEVWLTGGQTYKLVLKDSSGSTVWTVDSISGVNDTTVTLRPVDRWPNAYLRIGHAVHSCRATRPTFQVGRRVKTRTSGGTIYSRITASAYAALTTITVVNDSGRWTQDCPLSATRSSRPTNPSHSATQPS